MKKKSKRDGTSCINNIILIFMALIWMFDSIVKPLIILSTIPLSILEY